MRCSSYSIAADFDKKVLLSYFLKHYTTKIYVNALHIQLEKESELFIIYGAIIFWNVDKKSEDNIIAEILKFAKVTIEKVNCEVFEFEYNDKEYIKLDQIRVSKKEHVLSKLTVSYGLAQSAMLSYFEDEIEKAISNYENLVSDLAHKGVILLSRKDICKKLGSLFLVRNQINMQSDILDTPTFVWNYPSYEDLYKQTRYDMNIVARTSVLNKRLDIMQDLFNILNNQILSLQSARLEWVIILLIFLEIVITLILH
jgi:uncharacterized Rmd1/YagE family protein